MAERIVNACAEDSEELLALYRANIGGAADWNENYPSEETIAFDLSRNALFVMKNEAGEIIGAISVDSDEEVEKLECWNREIIPAREVSRLCVREDMRGRGIAGRMMNHLFGLFRAEGVRMVHILVRKGHTVAAGCYEKMGFVQVGECELFGKEFTCHERVL